MANKLVDAGEVYLVGQYELGTSTPTTLYKIGMAQNDSTTIGPSEGPPNWQPQPHFH